MTRRTARVLLVSTLMATVVVALAAGQFMGFRVNVTPSYPLGLWRIVALGRPVAVGDLVFICPPKSEVFAQALDRGYLRRGLCPGWMSPLIKSVAALGGQRVDVADSVLIDGRLVEHSDVRHADAARKDLRAWGGGVVPSGFVFLLSEYRGSYDSRYFGPVSVDGLLGLAQPVLVLAP